MQKLLKPLGFALAFIALLTSGPILADVVHLRGGGGSFDGGTVTGTSVFTAKVTFGSEADAANTIRFNESAGTIIGEGATADGFETTIAFADATADATFSFPALTAATRFVVSSTTAAAIIAGPTATRTITVLDQDQTVACIACDQTFSGTNIVSNAGTLVFGTANDFAANKVGFRTTQTPDSTMLFTGSTARAWHIADHADVTFDFNNGPCGTAACTNPQLVIHDSDQNVTNYQSLGLSGLTGKFVTTLTETTATSVVRIPVAAEAGASGVYIYTIYATDGSTPQVRSGRVIYSVTNDGGTETCVLGTPEETDNTPTGTLTVTVTCDTTPANAVDIQLDATSDLTQTTLEAYSTLIHVGAGEPLPQ